MSSKGASLACVYSMLTSSHIDYFTANNVQLAVRVFDTLSTRFQHFTSCDGGLQVGM